jgi:hypothetical protein
MVSDKKEEKEEKVKSGWDPKDGLGSWSNNLPPYMDFVVLSSSACILMSLIYPGGHSIRWALEERFRVYIHSS